MESDKLKGFSFVAIQVILLFGLIFLPFSNNWQNHSIINFLGMGSIIFGMVLVGFTTLNLGTAFTPTPVPVDGAGLKTEGLYRFVRHPIYSGVFLCVIGLVIRAMSFLAIGLGAVTIIFFYVKVNWEEQLLEQKYDDYQNYKLKVNRFFPKLF